MASRLDWKVEAINKLNNNQLIGAAFLPRELYAKGWHAFPKGKLAEFA
jgi:hypothetical protein